MVAFKVIALLTTKEKVIHWVIASCPADARTIVKDIYGDTLRQFRTVRPIEKKKIRRSRKTVCPSP